MSFQVIFCRANAKLLSSTSPFYIVLVLIWTIAKALMYKSVQDGSEDLLNDEALLRCTSAIKVRFSFFDNQPAQNCNSVLSLQVCNKDEGRENRASEGVGSRAL